MKPPPIPTRCPSSTSTASRSRRRPRSSGSRSAASPKGRSPRRSPPASLAGSAANQTAASGPRPLAEGSAFPGFAVALAEPGSELALVGRHRYSEYALVFHLVAEGGGTRLRAETRARFPGTAGRLYRAAVIGTRGHVLVTMRLLAAVKRRAER